MPRTAEQFTTESLARFVGGEAEIQNQMESYVYRGEIAEVKVEDGNLVIEFAWCAKNRGGPIGSEKGLSVDWDNETNLHYSTSLAICSASQIGNGRMAFNSPFTGELTVLFPANGSKMDPEHIHGLPDDIKARQRQKHAVWDATR